MTIKAKLFYGSIRSYLGIWRCWTANGHEEFSGMVEVFFILIAVVVTKLIELYI